MSDAMRGSIFFGIVGMLLVGKLTVVVLLVPIHGDVDIPIGGNGNGAALMNVEVAGRRSARDERG